MKKGILFLMLVLGAALIGCRTEVEVVPSCNCDYVSYTNDVTTDFVLTERTRTDWDGCEEVVLFEETFIDAHNQVWYYVIQIECNKGVSF